MKASFISELRTLLLLLLLPLLVGAETNLGFFNASLPSSALLPSFTLSLRSSISLSFRTCSSGQLMSQRGRSGDAFNISLTTEGALSIAWTSSSSASDSLLVEGIDFQSNQWFTIDSRFETGEIFLSVELGSQPKFKTLLSNSTLRRYLWDLKLSGGEGVLVGSGFTGCIQGLTIPLDSEDRQSSNVEWGDCPLKLQNGCEDVANPCWSYPCLNGGTCKREGADYFCECPFAFSGANCEADLGEKGCSLLPCQNNGTCEPKEGGTRRYDCLCPPGFTGVNCEIDIDDCAPGPCQNEASCLDLVDGYICNCTATGYRGHNCDENIDECDELNPCSNAATCIDSPGSYKCQCPSGIGGMNCDTLLDECSSNPCQNKGTCLDLSGFYSCQCAPDFTGINCDEQIDDCEGVVCPDLNSFCVDGNTSYSCECQFGYVPTGPDAALRCIEVNECDSNPCLNGATCEDSLGQFICNCSRGFTGLHCETDINFCADDPCSNGAECADGVESFTCECLAGYTGITCDVNINECDPNPCRNGKQCTDKVAGFTCDCGDAYEGEFCETEVDECKANPCQNGATCDDQVGRFACSCLDGFTGDRCETNIDDCPVDICLNGGRCVDGINNYTCECVGGWTGLHCDQIYDACSPNPCQEGTVCSSTPPSLDFSCTCQSVDECFSYEICSNNRCQCPFGFGGSECAENIDDCASSPCLNGATCVDRVGGYECKCVGEQVDLTAYTGDNRTIYRIGFEGDNCEVAIDECAYSPNICLNGGMCQIKESATYQFRCLCVQGGDYFNGRYCQLKRSYCLVHDQPGAPLCYNGGTCNDLNDSYSCDCAPGFTDASCETNIDECDSNPCVNGATCEDGVNGYTCFCPSGFTGFNCEADIDECGSMPCMNGGQCQDLVNRFVCNCTDTGYEGVQCEENIDECLSNPCFHGATCSDAIKGFTCNCHNGYTGDLCEVDVDECLDSKCANGATCVQRSEDPSRPGFSYADADSYDCLCAAGFTGVFCDFDIDECKSNPCLNGGSCINGINTYTCECDSGFTGTNCEINIDECALHTPCRNNGKCVDLVADYLCDCSPGGVAYGGKNCTFLFDICEQNLCHNNATCVPKLLNEEYRIQEYSCDCSPGFSGEHCEFSTVASFYGASWLRSDRTSNHDSTTITLDFRTTLPRGTLWENSGESSAEYVLVELLNGSDLRLVYSNRLQQQDLLLSTLSSSSLNNGAWHTVSVSVTRLRVEMQLNHVDCVASQCVTGFDFNHANVSVQHHDLGLTYFGGSPTPRVTPLIGCLRDILIDTFAILPQDYLSSDNSDNLQLGCNRSEQCTLHSCSNHGACNDLWFDFECECTRPYFGDICLTSFTPVTFGYEGAASSASFPISESEKITHQTKNDISLFFRTRASVGVIFYLGSANTYLTARMGNNQVIVESKLSLTKESFAINGDFSDGLQHFLLVNRTDSNLMLSVDSLSEEFTIKSDDLLVAENFYFGREPQEESRRRKKRSTEDDECFRGTMQDVRCNKHILQFAPVNQTTDLPSYGNPIMQNVTIGEISDDVCASQLPCTNNATCQVVFFNDFKCNCVDGYRGKNCSEPDFCFYATCPGESFCENLDDGFECLKPATFNGISSLIQYSSSIAESNALSTINVDFRTRQDSGTILHAKGIDNHTSHYVTVEMSDSVLSVKFNLGAEGSITSVRNEPFLQDGDWHNVTVTFNQDSVEMTIDNAHQYQTISRQDFTVAQILQGSSSIYVGGKSGNPSGALSFKGCLDAVRLSGRLLPFYNKTEIVGNHAAQQFIAEQLIDVETSCIGDPVCDSNPCQNGATCLDIWNEYECDCAVGFNGSKCDFNIDECEMHQCQNGATCVDAIANYTCGCSPGFIGWRCEVDIDECSSDPCLNNGTCWDQVDGYICNCTDNFTGDYCEYSLLESCETEPCFNNATCIPFNTTYEGVESFNCSCLPGYTDRLCESEIDYCVDEPCENNATCVSSLPLLDYICECPIGFTGRDCETDIDECESNPCLNGATCRDYEGEYECECPEGWEGVNCEMDINECLNDSCVNGECVNTPGGWFCNCTDTGFEGDLCEVDIDECDAVEAICLNGANCTNLEGDYECDCTVGYEGKNCQFANCSHGNCFNGGTCSVEDVIWSCDCVEYFEGLRCEVVGSCVEMPCKNGGSCEQDADRGFNCTCPTGWQGETCEVDTDECEVEPCLNGATCINNNGSYHCECASGFTGTHCETNIDECASDPCQNGGVCIDDVARYICNCSGTGYEGIHCEVDINECLEDPPPCGNYGLCVNLNGTFECDCDDTHIGSLCQSENWCHSYGEEEAFCLNQGNCSYSLHEDAQNATFFCYCTDDYHGDRCEYSYFVKERVENDTLGVLVISLICTGAAFIILILVVVACFVSLRSKRAHAGTYSPSRQEMDGSRVHMDHILKPPPEERLI